MQKILRKISGKIRNLEWQDWTAIALILIFFAVHLSIVMQYKQLPNPVYGGDYYYHFGHVNHLYSGGSVFESSHYFGEYEHYAWILPLMIAKTAVFLNTDVLKTTLFFQALLSVLVGVIGYFLGLKIFRNKNLALLFSFAWMSSRIIQATASGFSYLVLIPLGVLAIYYAKDWKDIILAGIVYGLCGIGNIVAFTAISLFMLIVFAYRVFENHISIDSSKLRIMHIHSFFSTLKKQTIFFLPILLIGVVISMLYLWPILFAYHGNMPNNWQDYAYMGKNGIFTYIVALFKGIFLDFSSPVIGMITTFVLFGLVILFVKIRKGEKEFLPILFILLTGLIGVLHQFITEPLFGKSIGYYGMGTVFYLARTMLFMLGTYSIYKLIEEKSESQKKVQEEERDNKEGKNERIKKRMFFGPKHTFLAVVLVALIYFSATVFAGMKAQQSSEFVVQMHEDAKWIMQNTDVDDVFLTSHGETGFALNALTGRKVVHMRRTHASPFIDVNERIADSAVILYGNDEVKRKELIEKYKIKYYYEDVQSSRSVQDCLNNWNAFGDPQYADASYSCLQTSPKYKEYLEKFGIETKNVNVRLDVGYENAQRYDMIAVKPSELKINTTILKEMKFSNSLIGVVMKINN